MQNLIDNFIMTIAVIQQNMPIVLTILAALWALHIVNFLLGYRLNILGIYPRHPFGLIGIAASPFLHANFTHLFQNSIPLFVFMCFVMVAGLPTFLLVSALIILLSGLAIWCFGRRAIHIGASGVIMGYLGYLLMNIYQQETSIAIGIGLTCLYYFGGILLSVFPNNLKTSWEGHLFGLFTGVASSYLVPPLLPQIQQLLR